jgi:RNA methyltransferase, TrmH family
MAFSSKPLKWYRELADKKARLETLAFLVEGERAIRQITETHPEAIIEIISVENPPKNFCIFPSRQVTESQFRYIATTQSPQGILAVVQIPEGVYSDRLPSDIGDKILLLEDIQDPGNNGTLIRTAAALGFSGAILTGKSADPFSPKCVQATAGSVLSIWLRSSVEYLKTAQTLKQRGFTLAAAEPDGDSAPEVLRGREKLILALGNEGAGLSEGLLELADYQVKVPTAREKAESLNVAACGAILMYLSTQGSSK